jgi:hypothetical protein
LIVAMFGSSGGFRLDCVVMDLDRRLPPPVLVVSGVADAARHKWSAQSLLPRAEDRGARGGSPCSARQTCQDTAFRLRQHHASCFDGEL